MREFDTIPTRHSKVQATVYQSSAWLSQQYFNCDQLDCVRCRPTDGRHLHQGCQTPSMEDDPCNPGDRGLIGSDEKATKNDERKLTNENIIIDSEYIGVHTKEKTTREIPPGAVSELPCSNADCHTTTQYDEALDSYLKWRYPWRDNNSPRSLDALETKGAVRQRLLALHRHAIEYDFCSLFTVHTPMRFFNTSVSDLPLQFVQPYMCLQDRDTLLQRIIFRESVSSAIGCRGSYGSR